MPTEAIIHLADRREPSLTGRLTRLETLTIAENYLAGGSRAAFTHEGAVLLIPFIGDIQLQRGTETLLIDESQSVFFDASAPYQIVNPYEGDTINFYIVQWPTLRFKSENEVVNIPIQQEKNRLIAIAANIWIGQYDGRSSGELTIQNPENKLFVYVLSGVFEVQDRLLHVHDALTLWNVDLLEFEALSNEAVLLIIA